jgi:DNA-binding NarL/FixJ family response regulator
MRRPIRLVLVEDNDVFREALEVLLGLRADVDIVGTAGDGITAIEVSRRLRPDVVLLDYRLPALDGVQTALTIRETCPNTAVVCLTASASARETEALYEAGAVECLTKDRELDDIVAAVQRAAMRADRSAAPARGRAR